MYFFYATFLDNHKIIQDLHNDVSSIDETKSKYYDVLNYKSKVVDFRLCNGSETWGVSLITGDFYVVIGGNPVYFKAESSPAPLNITGPF